MSPGKACAQSVHASMMLNGNSKSDFISDYKRTVIVLEAKNSEQIKDLYAYLDDTYLDANYYIDEGKNEVDAYSITALAVGPIAYDDEEKREIFEAFPLFGNESNYLKAYNHLNSIYNYERDNFWFYDTMPRFVRKTIKWLKSREDEKFRKY